MNKLMWLYEEVREMSKTALKNMQWWMLPMLLIVFVYLLLT